MSMVSLLFDIPGVGEWLFASDTSDTAEAGHSNLQVARAGRAARASTRAVRVLRFVRLFRVVRLLKVMSLSRLLLCCKKGRVDTETRQEQEQVCFLPVSFVQAEDCSRLPVRYGKN